MKKYFLYTLTLLYCLLSVASESEYNVSTTTHCTSKRSDHSSDYYTFDQNKHSSDIDYCNNADTLDITNIENFNFENCFETCTEHILIQEWLNEVIPTPIYTKFQDALVLSNTNKTTEQDKYLIEILEHVKDMLKHTPFHKDFSNITNLSETDKINIKKMLRNNDDHDKIIEAISSNWCNEKLENTKKTSPEYSKSYINAVEDIITTEAKYAYIQNITRYIEIQSRS